MYAVFKGLFLLVYEHLRQRPLRTSLTILGVAIGVSAWLSIRLANTEVFRSFETSVETVVGEASLQVSGGADGMNEQILLTIREHPAIREAHPIVTIQASLPGPQQEQFFPVLGLDLLELSNRDGLNMGASLEKQGGFDFLLDNDAVFLGHQLAERLKLGEGDTLRMHFGEQVFNVRIQGVVSASSPNLRRLDKMAIMDIAAAQALFGYLGRIDHINLVLEKRFAVSEVLENLKSMLPGTISVSRTSQRTRQVDAMVRVFQFNLTMLSTIGLLVGLFLVYNAIAFSVVLHRQEIGILRAIGMSRAQVCLVFLSEALTVGFLGGLLGCGLGFLMAQSLTTLVSQSATELYGAASVGQLLISWEMVFEGVGLGIGVALMGALKPSLEASGTVPTRALAPGDYEEAISQKSGHWVWVAGGLFVAAGFLGTLDPIHGIPFFGYAAVFLVLLGCILLGPLFIRSLRLFSHDGAATDWDIASSLAVGQLLRNPGRSSVTLSALVIGLAIMVGVGAMIQSFRHTVELWIDQTMMADLIVAPTVWWEGNDQDKEISGLPFEAFEVVRALPGVMAVDPYRERQAVAEGMQVVLVSRDIQLHATQSDYLFTMGDSKHILRHMLEQRGVIVSEVLAERLNVQPGSTLTIATPHGLKTFPLLGIFYDYATDGGKIVMDQQVYQEYWTDRKASVFAVYLSPGVRLESVRADILEKLGGDTITTISNGELRAEILEIFDRTFRVTYVLELIALCVAVLGIVNTLITAILERQREFATLRSLGASGRQIQQIVFWESGYLASLGTILGVLGGLALSVLLVKVINKQSFGWTIQLQIPSMTILEAVVVAAVAGLLAGYLPARWAASQRIAEGLRYE
ncbi:MAG: FtsX-like permease family protein [Nitrospirales bacterium]|nr:ABC transporter permease [Nitrospira sp.]MDR4500252.1 FtsX-like permease family protein [Nitrospirales bacterium]